MYLNTFDGHRPHRRSADADDDDVDHVAIVRYGHSFGLSFLSGRIRSMKLDMNLVWILFEMAQWGLIFWLLLRHKPRKLL